MAPALNVGCLQLSPVFSDVSASIAEADKLLEQVGPGELDILVLPEMAFTGYTFNAESIAPLLEKDGKGASHDWARKTAARLKCYVVVGYPEVEQGGTRYNSLVVISSAGSIVCNYRKCQLYPLQDPKWASEGPGFMTTELKFPRLQRSFKVVPGICMDINPYNFEAPWNNYELANYTAQSEADILLMCMAWHTRIEDSDGQHTSDVPLDPINTVRYWVARLEPLFFTSTKVIVCNRVGSERSGGVTSRYDGSSCCLKFGGENGIYAKWERSEESRSVLFRCELPL